MGERIEFIVNKSAEWAFQQRRQRQIILREQRETGQRQQVVEDDVATKSQPVGAGHGQACLLQGPQDFLEERLATPHQDQDVAGMSGTPEPRRLVIYCLPVVDETGDLGGDPVCQASVGAVFRLQVQWRVPGLAILALAVDFQIPDIDAARVFPAYIGGQMGDLLGNVAGLDGLGQQIRGEDRVYKAQHLRCRAPGGVQVHPLEFVTSLGGAIVVKLELAQQ